jgi:hypothetical protein
MTRIFGRGTSGGRAGGKSQNRAPQEPLDSSRQGQSADNRTIKSSSKISAPNFTANLANRYAPARLQTSHRKRTNT